jgi:hypothetical protein
MIGARLHIGPVWIELYAEKMRHDGWQLIEVGKDCIYFEVPDDKQPELEKHLEATLGYTFHTEYMNDTTRGKNGNI